MNDFTLRHVARIKFPTKHIVICEDDILCQFEILKHFNDIFERQGDIRLSIFSGTMDFAAMYTVIRHTDLLILDHDLPYGNGTDLMHWLNKHNFKIPIITFSGQPLNNEAMHKLGAQYVYTKDQVIGGYCDELIKEILYGHG